MADDDTVLSMFRVYMAETFDEEAKALERVIRDAKRYRAMRLDGGCRVGTKRMDAYADGLLARHDEIARTLRVEKAER